jgi:hypothetical protein
MASKDVLRASLPDIRVMFQGSRLKPGGVAELWDETGYQIFFTSTCSHCQHITRGKTAREVRENTDVCRGCMRLICLRCANKPCLPWEKQCEYKERETLKRQIEEKLRCY